MPESFTINIKENIPLGVRVAEAKKQLLIWLDSLDNPFEPNKDILRLIKYEKNDHEYIYKYILEREMKSLKKIKKP
jgi:hypothetical protein